MRNPPYKGQGTSLPEELDLEGQWVEEGVTFLFWTSPPGQRGEMYGIANEQGIEADGFDAHFVAKELGISLADLLSCNRRRLLRIALIPTNTTIGADSSVIVEIQTPDEGFRIVMNRASRFGRA